MIRRWNALSFEDHGADFLERLDVVERIPFRRDDVPLFSNGERAQIVEAEQIRRAARAPRQRLARSSAKSRQRHDFVAHSSLPGLITLVRTRRDFHTLLLPSLESGKLSLPDQIRFANRV